ncbi:hypothetical protein SGFS_068920 [Streptomyces graminofaciens]|uniref:Uncharacterized protein n=1 Tax=Streptomyces graminofaciens TaxID=68212 RepID=A0ABN5VQZ0_9ACTN|nr:hypothetical protein SGFS_068920 [Streptomyces graminofaciens]
MSPAHKVAHPRVVTRTTLDAGEIGRTICRTGRRRRRRGPLLSDPRLRPALLLRYGVLRYGVLAPCTHALASPSLPSPSVAVTTYAYR